MNSKRKGRKSTSPRVGCPFDGAGEEAEPGSWLSGLGQGGAAARPLDGGVLTRWGARAPARGPATAPWTLHRLARLACPRSLSSRSCAALRKERRQRENEERESGEENELGFLRNPATAAFDLLKRAGEPSIRSNGCK